MQIPDNEADRYALYNELTNACFESRSDRISIYERLRSYFLWGCSTDNNPATFNQIQPQIDLLVSFLFAAETTRFGIVIGESEGAKNDLPKVPALQAYVNSKWSDSNADVQYGQGVMWSLVFNSMFMKLVQRGRNTIPYLVDPHSFGVLREDLPFLDDQDAFAHSYSISKRTLDRLLIGHPRREIILNSVSASFRPDQARDVPAGVQRIIMSTFPMTSGPNGPGQITSPFNLIDGYRARVTDERVEMRELWVWDDKLNDYRMATIASGGVCVFDRENPDLQGEHPFIQICPNPSYDYFFGHSEVDRVTALQDFLEMRMEQIAELLSRQVKPPNARNGQWTGIQDETDFAFQTFGAGVATTDPTAKFQTFPPVVPNDVFAEIREIKSQFNEVMGLNNVVQGKGDSGVRSTGHAAELARLGSSRIRKRAYTLEDGLDKIGTQYLQRIQTFDDTVLTFDNGGKTVPFIAKQFTDDYAVKVDGHSSSPIFTEDKKATAVALMQARAIDRATFIEDLDPPGKQEKLEKLKVIEENERIQAEQARTAELAAKKPGAGLSVAK